MSENLSNKECDKKEIGDRKREGEMGSHCLMGTDSQVYQMKRIMEMDGGIGCTTL